MMTGEDNNVKFRVELELDYTYHVEVTMEATGFQDLAKKIEDKYGGTVKILNTEVL